MQPTTANPTTSAGAMTNLQNYQGAMQNPAQLLAQQQQQLGVPQAQQSVTGLRGAVQNTTNLLNNVAPNVMGNTKNSLVTSSQAGQQVANQSAPLNSTLGQQNTQLGNATTDYNNLSTQAQNMASAAYTGETQQESYLQNIYNALFGQEQAKAASDLEQQKLAEQIREANLTASTASQFNPSTNNGNGNNAPAAPSANMVARAGGGFNFQDANGNTINAAQYAHAKGIDFTRLLSQMAAQGDAGAKTALGFVGNDAGYDPTKVNSQQLADLYKSLTGNTAQVYKAPTVSGFKQNANTRFR